MQNGIGLGGALPASAEKLAHRAAEKRERHEDKGHRQNDEKRQAPVIREKHRADRNEEKKLFNESRHFVDNEHADSRRIGRNAVHQLARGTLGDARNGKALNLFKDDVTKIMDDLIARKQKEVFLERSQRIAQKLEKQDLHEHDEERRPDHGFITQNIVIGEVCGDFGRDKAHKRGEHKHCHRCENIPFIRTCHVPKTADHHLLAKASQTGLRAGTVCSAAFRADKLLRRVLMKGVFIVSHEVIDRLDGRRHLVFMVAICAGQEKGFSVLRRVFRKYTADTRGKLKFLYRIKRKGEFFLFVLIDRTGLGIDQHKAIDLTLWELKVEIVFPKRDHVLLSKLRTKRLCACVKPFVFGSQRHHPAQR